MWVLLVIGLRVFVGVFDPEIRSHEEASVDYLMEFSQSTKDTEEKNKALQALFKMSLQSENVRERIRRNFQEWQPKGENKKDVADLIFRFENSAEVILQNTMRFDPQFFLQQTRKIALGIVVCAAFFLLIFIPLILIRFASRRSLSKIFGKGGWGKIFFIYLLYIGLYVLIDTKKIPEEMFLLQLSAAIFIALVGYDYVRSNFLAVALGIRNHYIHRSFYILLVMLLSSFAPLVILQLEQTKPKAQYGERQILSAIYEVEKENKAYLKPIVEGIAVARHLQISIRKAAIETLGKIGDEKSLTVILPLVQSPFSDIRKSALDTSLKLVQQQKNEPKK